MKNNYTREEVIKLLDGFMQNIRSDVHFAFEIGMNKDQILNSIIPGTLYPESLTKEENIKNQ
jgi:hypothetical protein